ncbi:hypothetical protein [Flavivirga algicola]|uniref:Lipoprotein n=1 Tax=Flavivirga algicola TaxID=2729136 RepID=A0ABX1S0L7_9FLAO|nr:hypothetical protein [Flavivirga algicola]NMH87979.1 hypothetical protein [Flavivirga algicola]
MANRLKCYIWYGKNKEMIKQLITLIVILPLVALLGCGQENSKMNTEGTKLYQENINYPYSASEKRKAIILNNMNKLEKGMTKNEVIKLITYPDEVNLTYEFKNAKPESVIGFSLVYLLRRNAKSGSTIEKKEQLLRVHFDNSEKLLWAYSVDIDAFKVIEK